MANDHILSSFYKEEHEHVGDEDKQDGDEGGQPFAERFKTIEEEDEGRTFMTNNIGGEK